jgi:hypothetical protein
MSDPKIDYHCPGCGELASLVFNDQQALCGNGESCAVIMFNPSDPDLTGDIQVVDTSGWQEQKE